MDEKEEGLMAAKGKKKKRNTLVFLFICILVFAGGYALLSVYGPKDGEEDEEEQAEEVELLSMKEDSISSIEFENSFCSMKLLNQGEAWFWEKDKKFPLNQEYANDMAETVSDLKAIRKIVEDPEDMEEFGLKDPEITISFQGASGENTLYLGDESPSSDGGYYCRLNDDNTVYEVDASVFTSFNYSNHQMMVLEDIPEITTTQITKLEIKNPKEFDFTAVNKAIGDSSSWSIEDSYSQPVVGDESEISTFLGSYGSFSYKEAVEYNCKDFASYGLEEKKPATAFIQLDYYELVDVEEDDEAENTEDTGEETEGETKQETKQERVDHQAKIVIGNQNEDGDYFVRVNDSNYVYLMDEESVDKLLPDKAYLYVEKIISRISVDNMAKMTFTADGKDYIITRKEKTTVNDDGEEETETDYFFNNKTMETSVFNALTMSWSSLETAQELTKKEKKQLEKEEENIVLSVDIEGTGMDQHVEFLAFNKSYYAVKDGEDMFFLIDKRDVDNFIQKLKDREEK